MSNQTDQKNTEEKNKIKINASNAKDILEDIKIEEETNTPKIDEDFISRTPENDAINLIISTSGKLLTNNISTWRFERHESITCIV